MRISYSINEVLQHNSYNFYKYRLCKTNSFKLFYKILVLTKNFGYNFLDISRIIEMTFETGSVTFHIHFSHKQCI